MNTEPAPSTPTIAERPESPLDDILKTAHAYQAYLACFSDATQALLYLSHNAGIAVAYMDRGYIEAERDGPLTEEQWEELTYQLDEYDDHVSFDDTNSLFLDQIFSDTNIPRRPDDEEDDEPDDHEDEELDDNEDEELDDEEQDRDDDLDGDEGVNAQ